MTQAKKKTVKKTKLKTKRAKMIMGAWSKKPKVVATKALKKKDPKRAVNDTCDFDV